MDPKKGTLGPNTKKFAVNALTAASGALKSPEGKKVIQSLVTQPKKANATGGKLMGLLKLIAPTALSLIPGGAAFAPLASSILSTMNDDEWFDAFTGNGASFNQFLQDMGSRGTISGKNVYELAPAAAIMRVWVKPNTYTSYLQNFMPQVIADVRRITNNVLVDDVTKYDSAFIMASQLLAVHYMLQKYIKLSAHQPLNIPIISGALTLISPENMSQLIGIAKSLEDFVSSTIRLPYAYTAYLRWRFGTTFFSSNTGKPALILYDLFTIDDVQSSTTISELTQAISMLQAAYIAAGRAGADLKLTYQDHVQDLSVEEAHYDEKEFNLRSNMTTFRPSTIENDKERPIRVLMDSRLDMNAAIQAVTISTATTNSAANVTPFPVESYQVFFYNQGTAVRSANVTPQVTYSGAGTYGLGATSKVDLFPTGWNWIGFTDQDLASAGATGSATRMVIGGKPTAGGSPLLIQYTPMKNDGSITVNTITMDYLKLLILGPSLLSSLQFHNRDFIIAEYGINPEAATTGDGSEGKVSRIRVTDTILSYDTAYLYTESLQNIQRAAIRNLVRSDYKRKAIKETVAATTDAANAVVDAVVPGSEVVL